MFSFDRQLFSWLNLEPGTPAVVVWLAITISQWLPMLALGGGVLLLARRPQHWQRTLALILLAMLLAWAASALLKDLVEAPRPYKLGLGKLWVHHWSGNGFPSSHTTITMAVGAAAWLAPWPLAVRLPLVLMGPLMAWSRVALGIHFPIDVLVGMTVGVASATMAHLMLKRLWPLPRALPATAEGGAPLGQESVSPPAQS